MKKFFLFLLFVIVAIVVLSFFFDLDSTHVEEVKICSQIVGNQCPSDEPVFEVNTPQIVVSCKLGNPAPDSKVEFAWYYKTDGEVKIDAVILSSGDHIGTLEMHSSLSRPNNGWPAGDYEVVIKIMDTEKEPIIKKFYVR